jgi:hypothetical protein
MFALPAVGEFFGGCGCLWECHGCHPGLSEDFVGTASKVAFMGYGFVSNASPRNSENLCPPGRTS